MSARRRQRQAAGRAGTKGRSLVRVIEAVLWVGVVVLLVFRLAPQVRAAVGWRGRSVAAPAASFAMLDGGTLQLEGLKGQVVLVNFWATWCPPCRAEMPGFQKIYADRHHDGFTVVGVSMDEVPPRQVAAFLRDHGIAYPVALGSADNAAEFGGIDSFPTSFLIDRQGRVRYVVRGIFAEFTLRAAVNRLLAERS